MLEGWLITGPEHFSETKQWVVGLQTPTHCFTYLTFKDVREAFHFILGLKSLGCELIV